MCYLTKKKKIKLQTINNALINQNNVINTSMSSHVKMTDISYNNCKYVNICVMLPKDPPLPSFTPQRFSFVTIPWVNHRLCQGKARTAHWASEARLLVWMWNDKGHIPTSFSMTRARRFDTRKAALGAFWHSLRLLSAYIRTTTAESKTSPVSLRVSEVAHEVACLLLRGSACYAQRP